MGPENLLWLLICLFLILLILVFFLPVLIAFGKRHPHRWWILLFNAALGGSGIGWLAALLWSLGLILGNSKTKEQF